MHVSAPANQNDTEKVEEIVAGLKPPFILDKIKMLSYNDW